MDLECVRACPASQLSGHIRKTFFQKTANFLLCVAEHLVSSLSTQGQMSPSRKRQYLTGLCSDLRDPKSPLIQAVLTIPGWGAPLGPNFTILSKSHSQVRERSAFMFHMGPQGKGVYISPGALSAFFLCIFTSVYKGKSFKK